MNHGNRKPPIAPPVTAGYSTFHPYNAADPVWSLGPRTTHESGITLVAPDPLLVRWSRAIVLTVALILTQAIACHLTWQWVLEPRMWFPLWFSHWVGFSCLTAHGRFRSILDRDGRVDPRRAVESLVLLPGVIIAVAFVVGRLLPVAWEHWI